MIRIDQIKLKCSHTQRELEEKIRKTLRLSKEEFSFPWRIRRKSLDARKKPELFAVYTIDVFPDSEVQKRILNRIHDKKIHLQTEETYQIPGCGQKETVHRPVVIGFGPAGLFCAYLLALRGFNPIVLERGEDADTRSRKVNAFWDGSQKLDPESNVQFGEGGAGTFSDGKLNTSVNDKQYRNRFVLDTFVSFGAKEETAYLAKPHLGTDELKKIVRNMREKIIELGGSVIFGMKVTDVKCENARLKSLILQETFSHKDLTEEIRKCDPDHYILDTDIAVLAIGHSARDTFRMLLDRKLAMEQKNFAVGLRMVHPQSTIDLAQYGAKHQDLLIGAADYKVSRQCSNGKSVYSFCMCPGGYVVNASSETGRLAVNGMSYSGRDSDSANAALIVPVRNDDLRSDDVLAGLFFQEKLEEKAYALGNGNIPMQRFDDFEKNRITDQTGTFQPQVKGSTQPANLRELFCEEINEALIEAVHAFADQIKDFDDPNAVFLGVESRTSSPVRILRDAKFQSNIRGIYPCGEGAGYAGGIMSAAMDGMRVAEFIISLYDGIC